MTVVISTFPEKTHRNFYNVGIMCDGSTQIQLINDVNAILWPNFDLGCVCVRLKKCRVSFNAYHTGNISLLVALLKGGIFRQILVSINRLFRSNSAQMAQFRPPGIVFFVQICDQNRHISFKYGIKWGRY